jgi:hypothetical protein
VLECALTAVLISHAQSKNGDLIAAVHAKTEPTVLTALILRIVIGEYADEHARDLLPIARLGPLLRDLQVLPPADRSVAVPGSDTISLLPPVRKRLPDRSLTEINRLRAARGMTALQTGSYDIYTRFSVRDVICHTKEYIRAKAAQSRVVRYYDETLPDLLQGEHQFGFVECVLVIREGAVPLYVAVIEPLPVQRFGPSPGWTCGRRVGRILVPLVQIRARVICLIRGQSYFVFPDGSDPLFQHTVAADESVESSSSSSMLENSSDDEEWNVRDRRNVSVLPGDE